MQKGNLYTEFTINVSSWIQVLDGTYALEQDCSITSGLTVTVTRLVVYAVMDKEFIGYLKTPMIIVEAVMVVTQLWNIVNIVCM